MAQTNVQRFAADLLPPEQPENFPDELWRALVLHVREGVRVGAIASELGLTYEQARARVEKASRHLAYWYSLHRVGRKLEPTRASSAPEPVETG